MSTRPPSRVVFVGNIPYGQTEEQIKELFEKAGTVLSFRLVYDRETGRPKGFGFAEYPDADSAASAVRNLNDYEVMGRKLRVDFSNEGSNEDDGHTRDGAAGGTSAAGFANHGSNGVASHGAGAANPASSSLPPLPQGKELPAGVTVADAISRTLNTLPPPQLLDILTQMKALAVNEPQRATELLSQAPQLSYAIFQALLLMGLVSPDAINSVLDNPPGGAAPPPAPVGYPYGNPAATGTPPVATGGYAPPPAVAAPAPAPVALGGGQDPEALMAAVMQLPQETIDQLPEAERQQIMALRATYGAQHR